MNKAYRVRDPNYDSSCQTLIAVGILAAGDPIWKSAKIDLSDLMYLSLIVTLTNLENGPTIPASAYLYLYLEWDDEEDEGMFGGLYDSFTAGTANSTRYEWLFDFSGSGWRWGQLWLGGNTGQNVEANAHYRTAKVCQEY